MITPRDLDKILSLLRRVYASIVIDMSSHDQRHQPRVPRRERHDHRDRHLRLDDDPQHDRHGRHVPLDRLSGVQGPLPRQPGRQRRRHRARRPRSAPSAACPSTASCPTASSSSSSNNEGVPFVLADPTAPVSQDIVRVASELLGAGARRRSPPGAARPRRVRPATHRRLRLGGRRPDGPARDRPPLAARVDDLPRRQRPGAVRRRAPTTRSSPSRPRPSTRSSSATSRRSSSPATRPRPSASAAFRRRYDLPVLGVIRPGRLGGRAGDAQPAGRGHRHAGDDPLARLLQRDQGREPGHRGLRARDARRSCRWSRPAS